MSMNNPLHPIMQQALAPFAPPQRVLKAAAGNCNLSPIVVAKTYRAGKNQYEVMLACSEWPEELPYRSATQLGVAFGYAVHFSILSAKDAQLAIDTIRAYSTARQ